MTLNPSIILAGQGVNALQALSQGNEAGARMADIRRAGEVQNLYRTQGPGIMAGDQNALAALSRFDPAAALGIEGTRLGMEETRQGMRIREEQLQLARAAGAREAQRFAMTLSAEQQAEERRQIAQGLATAIPALRSGNLDSVNQIFRTAGLPAVGSLDEAALAIAGFEGALQAFEGAQAVMGVGQGIEPTDDIREYQFAQANGFPGTFQDWMTRNQQSVQFTGPDGTTFMMGPGGQQQVTGPTPELPAPIMQPVTEARNTFGIPSVLQGAANSVADAVGADMPFPQQDEALAQVRLTADAILQELAEGYDRPPLELLRSIRENIPEPGRLLQGPQSAVNRYNAIRADLQSQLAVEEQQALRTRNPNESAAIQRRISSLRNSMARIDRILEGMTPQTGGAGVSADDAALIQRYLD